jgi:RNA polymerase sigma factor (sigma-70 family)
MEARVIDDTLMSIEEVYEQYKKLLNKLAWKYRKAAEKRKLDHDDVMSFAKEGMILAFQRFDQSMGLKFMTYLFPQVEFQIKRRLRDYSIGLKFSRSVQELISKSHSHPEMSLEEVGEKYGYKKKIIKEALIYKTTSYQSMDEPIKHDKNDDKMKVQDTIILENDDSLCVVEDFIKLTGDKIGSVIKMRMDGKTQREIGECLGVGQVQTGRLLIKAQSLWTDYEKGMFPLKLTVEQYNEYKESGMLDKDIAKEMGVTAPTLSIWKKKRLSGVDKTKAVKSIVKVKQQRETNTTKEPKQLPQNEDKKRISSLERELKVREKAIKDLEMKLEDSISKEKHNRIIEEGEQRFLELQLDEQKARLEWKKYMEDYFKEHSKVLLLDSECENLREQLRQAREESVKYGKENEHLWGLLKIKMEG